MGLFRDRIEKPDKIRACVCQIWSGMWIGKIKRNDIWETVTTPCFTKFGAKLKLKIWKIGSQEAEYFDL